MRNLEITTRDTDSGFDIQSVNASAAKNMKPHSLRVTVRRGNVTQSVIVAVGNGSARARAKARKGRAA